MASPQQRERETRLIPERVDEYLMGEKVAGYFAVNVIHYGYGGSVLAPSGGAGIRQTCPVSRGDRPCDRAAGSSQERVQAGFAERDVMEYPAVDAEITPA
jgi:hypothetical protein